MQVIQNIKNYINLYRNIRLSGIISSFSLLVLSFLILHPIILDLTSASATSPTASTTTLTMTQGSGTASINLAVKDPDGTFVTSNDDEKIEFNITTNNYTGYTLIISSSSDDGLLTNGSGSSLSSIDSILGTSDFDTSTHNNQWGYKPSKYNGVRNEAYLPAPTTSATVLDKTMEANSTATANNTYDIGLGARADYSTPAGSYSASFIITAVANPVPYSISFTDTSGDTTVAGMPETILGSTDDVEVKLPTNIPQRTGYTFSGWCSSIPTASATSCPGTIYQPSTPSTPVYVGIDQTAAMNATMLYAVWEAEPVSGVTVNFSYAGGGTTGVSSVVFTETNTGTSAGSVSTSGGTVALNPGVQYTVSTNPATNYGVKSYALNLAANGTLSYSSDNTYTYFTPNSNNATITVNTCLKTITGTMQDYNTNIDYLCDDATGTLTDSRDSKSYTVGVVTSNNRSAITRKLWMTQNLSIGCKSDGTINPITLTSANSNVTANYTTPATSGHSNSYTNSKIVCSNDADKGAWYNYVAATAGTITGDDNSTRASYSICPSGWKLPSHADISDAASNWEAFRPVTGGYYLGGTLNNTGLGTWWSTDASGGTDRWRLDYDSFYLYTRYNSRYYGFYVRCVKE